MWEFFRSSQKCDKCDASHFLSPEKVTNVTSLTQIWDGKLGRNPGKTDPKTALSLDRAVPYPGPHPPHQSKTDIKFWSTWRILVEGVCCLHHPPRGWYRANNPLPESREFDFSKLKWQRTKVRFRSGNKNVSSTRQAQGLDCYSVGCAYIYMKICTHINIYTHTDSYIYTCLLKYNSGNSDDWNTNYALMTHVMRVTWLICLCCSGLTWTMTGIWKSTRPNVLSATLVPQTPPLPPLFLCLTQKIHI